MRVGNAVISWNGSRHQLQLDDVDLGTTAYVSVNDENSGVVSSYYGAVPSDPSMAVLGSGLGGSPNAASIVWGNGTGWRLMLGHRGVGTFQPRVMFVDDGLMSISYQGTPSAPAGVIHVDGKNTAGGVLINHTGNAVKHIRLQRSDLGSTISIQNDAGNFVLDAGLRVTGTTAFSGKVTIGTTTPNTNFENLHTEGANSGISMSSRTAADYRWVFYAASQEMRVYNDLRNIIAYWGVNGNYDQVVNSGHTGNGSVIRLDRNSGGDHTFGRATLRLASLGGTDSTVGIAFNTLNYAPQLIAWDQTGERLNVVNYNNTAYRAIAASAFTTVSSLRFKQDVQWVDPTQGEFLPLIEQITPIWFKNKESGNGGIHGDHVCEESPCAGTIERPCPCGVPAAQRFGLAAENIAAVFPAAATFDTEGAAEAVDYQVVSAMLLAAVRELALRVSTLETSLS